MYEAARQDNRKSSYDQKKKDRPKLKTLYENTMSVNTENIKIKAKSLNEILPEINPQAFKFLPSSIISKLYHVIDRYSSILGLQLLHTSSNYDNLFTLEND